MAARSKSASQTGAGASREIDKTCDPLPSSADAPTQDEGLDPSFEPGASKYASPAIPAGLHLVATPIGNLADITLRALATLRRADIIACEDSRVTGKLKAAFGLSAPLFSYHDHNADRAGPKLMEHLERGEIVALVSDAGTPLVSDPGFRLVRSAIEAGIAVIAVPGPSAALAALVASGLPTDRFLFVGFPPSRTQARRRALAELATAPATLVIFESPKRLARSLADMADALGPRQAAVTRELTKLHEEIRRGSLVELAAHYAAAAPPRGEVTIVIAPAGPPGEAGDDEIDARLERVMGKGASVRDASATIATETGRSRRAVYARALAIIAAQNPDDGGDD
jgi:16S rRNA (cytidine1402-2'-O)-methyltransferase